MRQVEGDERVRDLGQALAAYELEELMRDRRRIRALLAARGSDSPLPTLHALPPRVVRCQPGRRTERALDIALVGVRLEQPETSVHGFSILAHT